MNKLKFYKNPMPSYFKSAVICCGFRRLTADYFLRITCIVEVRNIWTSNQYIQFRFLNESLYFERIGFSTQINNQDSRKHTI